MTKETLNQVNLLMPILAGLYVYCIWIGIQEKKRITKLTKDPDVHQQYPDLLRDLSKQWLIEGVVFVGIFIALCVGWLFALLGL